MYRRQIVLLCIVLAAAASLLGWRLASDWKRASLRYGSTPGEKSAPAAMAPTGAPQRPVASTADILAKNIFSSDRNSQVSLEDHSQPPPVLPVVFGTMNLGGRYEALMTDRPQSGRSAFRRAKEIGRASCRERVYVLV